MAHPEPLLLEHVDADDLCGLLVVLQALRLAWLQDAVPDQQDVRNFCDLLTQTVP